MNLIAIGKIVKPQGIKGEVKIKPYTDIPAVFENNTIFLLGKSYDVERYSFRQGFYYVKFKQVLDRNMAEKLRNFEVCIEREILKKLNDDELLIDDIIGMVLFDTEGELVGQIMDVEDYGNGYILIIEENKRLVQVPYVEGVFNQTKEKLIVNRKKYEEVRFDG